MRKKLNDIVLAIDFNSTIAHRDAFPKIGSPLTGAVEAINKLYNEGYFIIVQTCRSGMHQLEAEQYLLDIEREAFLSLCTERKTLERIQFMLTKGKPLRNQIIDNRRRDNRQS